MYGALPERAEHDQVMQHVVMDDLGQRDKGGEEDKQDADGDSEEGQGTDK